MEILRAALALVPIVAFLCFTGGGAADTVLDIDGHPVVSGTDYYVLPVFRGRGGGLTLAGENASSCPLHVVQEQQEVSRGLPVTFSPVKMTKAIPESTDLNIKFSAVSRCVQSTVWRVGGLDPRKRQRLVTSGGVEGRPGAATVSNWFKIEKDGSDYKLVFCPSVCSSCRVACGDVGVFIDNNVRRLVITDGVPFKVFFKRA